MDFKPTFCASHETRYDGTVYLDDGMCREQALITKASVFSITTSIISLYLI